jgi:hypothetical protein
MPLLAQRLDARTYRLVAFATQIIGIIGTLVVDAFSAPKLCVCVHT